MLFIIPKIRFIGERDLVLGGVDSSVPLLPLLVGVSGVLGRRAWCSLSLSYAA